MTPRTLERRALKAHSAGQTWDEFWGRNGDHVRAAEPYDVDRFHKLERRLHHLVTCGDGDLWCRGTPWLEHDKQHKEMTEAT